MRNLFKMIPRWNTIYSCPVAGKERYILDAAYNAVAKVCSDGHPVKQIRFNRTHEYHITQIYCSRYTFYLFLDEFSLRTKKYIWKIDKVK